MGLQNKFVLGTASLLIMAASTAFVLQPTVAHAAAAVQMQQDKKTGEVVIFGKVSLKNGKPESGVRLSVGMREHNGYFDRRQNVKILASTTTGQDGSFKLWISNPNSRHMRSGNVLNMYVHPSGGRTYEQDIVLKAGDIASVTIAMRTPLIPVLPFTVFTY